MGRAGIEAVLDLMDEAFRGRGIEESNESQSLLVNLASVPREAWRALPVGATRSIESIAMHVGSTKIMYDEYAFGDGRLQWSSPEVEPWPEGDARMEDVRAWLEDVQRRFVTHVAALADDAELDRMRLTNWGEHRPTRWIVAAMVTHDAYHAGEINHMRSLLGGEDRWRYIQLGLE
ncbi:MAG: DinB family protein [Chloroflexota bacterium]